SLGAFFRDRHSKRAHGFGAPHLLANARPPKDVPVSRGRRRWRLDPSTTGGICAMRFGTRLRRRSPRHDKRPQRGQTWAADPMHPLEARTLLSAGTGHRSALVQRPALALAAAAPAPILVSNANDSGA